MALDRFFAKIERRAFIIARVATGNDDDALDLVQDSMLQLTRKYLTRPSTEWGPLFHRILQSRIRDWYRRSRVRNRWRVWFAPSSDEQPGDPLEHLADNRQGPAELVRGRQTLATLEQALQALPLRQQQAFMLRVWEELDVAHTAKIMGCSIGSVKTHFSRAVHSLRKRLEEES